MSRRKKLKWYQKSIRWNSKILDDLRQLCKFYQVGVRYANRAGNTVGYANLKKDIIHVYLYDTRDKDKETVQDVMCTVMHELGHILNKRNKKYYSYHSPREEFTVKNSEYTLRHGFNAELYTDKIGKQLMKLHYPKMKYKSGYHHCEADKRWYRKNYLKDYKEYLNKRKKK